MRLTFKREHVLSRLHDELLAAGLEPEIVEGDVAGTEVWLTFTADVDSALVEKIVAAHNPTPVPPPPDPALAIAAATTLDELKTALLEQLDPALTTTVKGA